ncbi:c-type cytochrome [Phaeobacter sp.]|uniref:c-type cytochrome n=1 Tax=Phaeobacter sp. TaxID=1902409 RepID=UPI0025CD18B6|nr:c-type cytochrome [Phaeobacter sp.]
MKLGPIIATLSLLSTPVFAAGDAAKGEQGFAKCKACHRIVSDEGEVIVKGGRTGPNLWGIAGRPAASAEDYRYGQGLKDAKAKGLIWTAEHFAAFTTDPRGFLRVFLDDEKAKSKMAFRLKNGADDIFSFLAQHGPDDVDVAGDGPTTD